MVIPWPDVIHAQKRFGMVATIIDLETSADTLSIRCYGADELIEIIEAARKAV
ncbi:MAG: hypothetical protein HRT81_09935 [Henriciella sp.]|nr:hypothetical protein [Henriciella sp.]